MVQAWSAVNMLKDVSVLGKMLFVFLQDCSVFVPFKLHGHVKFGWILIFAVGFCQNLVVFNQVSPKTKIDVVSV